MTLRAAVYSRISDDRAGRGLGVARQREDCAKLVADRSWELVASLKDNDRSAYTGKPRKEYVRLLELVRADALDVIVAWHPDRLHRSPSELEDFISLIEAHGVSVVTCQAGQWDLGTPAGRMVARQIGAVSRYESEHKSDRVRRALEQRAEMGRPHGRVPYGWRRVEGRDVVDQDQAGIIREIAGRIISGDSLRSITADLNARGVLSPTGKTWGKQMLRHVVLRERNVGLRTHRGQVIGDGDWPPILDRGQWE
ncbi:MAG: recombinase family protein, partial [Actinomycetes bacterium]